MGTRHRWELLVAAATAAAVAAYVVVDSTVVDRLLYLGVLVCVSTLAWAGALRAPAGRRLVGGLVAAGITLTTLGDTAWELLAWRGRDTDVSVADPLWFASYALLAAALWIVLRSSGDGRAGLDVVLDAIAMGVLSILVFWGISIHTIVEDQSVPAQVRLVWAAYPVADAVLLALVVRALMSRSARAHLGAWFAVGVGLWLVVDVAYLASAEGDSEKWMDAVWMVAPVLLAGSTWRRVGPAADAPRTSRDGRMVQLGMAIVPLLVPPVLMLFADTRGETDHLVLLVLGATTLTVLALVRTARLMRSEERALRELELARDAALDASRAKSMFLATMSHEIRTPLTTVLGTAELLADTELDELQLALVARMRRSGDLLNGLVDDVLDFSRIEAGRVELAATRVEVAALVDHLVDAWSPRAARAGIRLEHEVVAGVPAGLVTDRGRLLQVLGNLLDNAVKFTQQGGVRLVVRSAVPDHEEGRAAGARLEFVVSDTGIGMTEEDLATVFEAFRQVDGSTTRRYGGSGLGLAICRQLVTSLGGDLTVTSEPGAGTTFVVSVPEQALEPPRSDPAGPEPVGRTRQRSAYALG